MRSAGRPPARLPDFSGDRRGQPTGGDVTDRLGVAYPRAEAGAPLARDGQGALVSQRVSRDARSAVRGTASGQRAAATSAAIAASTSAANRETLCPSGPSGRDDMNGSPEFSALIDPRYSLMTW
jgi:hypothetical protein